MTLLYLRVNSFHAKTTPAFENNNDSSNLTLTEDLPPTFSGCPPTDIVVSYAAGVCDATVTWTPPTASPAAVSVTSNYSPGHSSLPGTTAVV